MSLAVVHEHGDRASVEVDGCVAPAEGVDVRLAQRRVDPGGRWWATTRPLVIHQAIAERCSISESCPGQKCRGGRGAVVERDEIREDLDEGLRGANATR